MTPAEALMAATINAAHSIRKANDIGSIEEGKIADIVIFNEYGRHDRKEWSRRVAESAPRLIFATKVKIPTPATMR
jgi:imidazolonepropionase-like amidohydrolase